MLAVRSRVRFAKRGFSRSGTEEQRSWNAYLCAFFNVYPSDRRLAAFPQIAAASGGARIIRID